LNKKSIAFYLTSIGLLLVITIGWYIYAVLSQPEPDSLNLDIQPSETLFLTPYIDPAMVMVPPHATLTPAAHSDSFDGNRAYDDVKAQIEFGPRVVGTDAHALAVRWIQSELVQAGWQVEVQKSEAMGHPVQNIVAKRDSGDPQIIVGAHYDSRMYADQDPNPDNRSEPVPGANDGASGVAVLLELARTLPTNTPNVWLVFFDTEDNGQINGWDWILGSREFVANNPEKPQAVVILDMIGDADLNIYKEMNSNVALTDSIWAVADELGYAQHIIPSYRHSMLDDHTPFILAGIPAVDIIDFDYPPWHTTEDTPDKVSAASLEIVGKTMWTWITQQGRQ